MPGLQLASFWEGNRSELLATYILSSVAAVVPVPAKFDFGLDLLCTITRHEGRALYAGRAFGVQVKSASEREVSYGGLNDGGQWKDYELKWLYGQDQPIILCIVDLKQWNVKLYSTLRMWWVRWMRGMPGEVVLVPDLEIEDFKGRSDDNRYPYTPLGRTRNGKKLGDGYSYRVPLGKPIAVVGVNDPETRDRRDMLRKCLDAWVELDYRNIRHYRMGVPYTEEWEQWGPNVPPSRQERTRITYFSNPTPDKNIKEILLSFAPAVVALLHNLQAQNQEEKLRSVIPTARLVRDYKLLDQIGEEVLQELEG